VPWATASTLWRSCFTVMRTGAQGDRDRADRDGRSGANTYSLTGTGYSHGED
jgi:hypothetical protein